MEYNLVTNYKIIQEIKKYKHFKISLGFASYTDKGDGNKVLSENDKFAYFYNKRYNTTIYGQGLLGDISTYTDHYIHEDVVAIYYNKEEFVFNFDFDKVKEKGIEWYLGSLLKNIDEQIESKKEPEKLIIEDKVGDATTLNKNPGGVTWADIVAYKQAKRI